MIKREYFEEIVIYHEISLGGKFNIAATESQICVQVKKEAHRIAIEQ